MAEHDVLQGATHGFRKSKDCATKLQSVLENKAEALDWKREAQDTLSDARSKCKFAARHFAEQMVKNILAPTIDPQEEKIKALTSENAKLKEQIKILEAGKVPAEVKQPPGVNLPLADTSAAGASSSAPRPSPSPSPPSTQSDEAIARMLQLMETQQEAVNRLQSQFNTFQKEKEAPPPAFQPEELAKNNKTGFSLKELAGTTEATVILI